MFGTLLGPEITGLLFLVVRSLGCSLLRGRGVGGGGLVVSGFSCACFASCPVVVSLVFVGVSAVGGVGVCWGCWLRTA